MTTAAEVEPGLYDISAEDYHADPVPGGSLTSSGARRLLPPSCPALYRWEQDNPQPPKTHLELGTAAHKLVLGNGPDIDVIDHDNYTTKTAQQQRDEARDMGALPLLRHEYEQVQAMAEAIRQHPVARILFDPDRGGRPEQTLIWRDQQASVMRRARLDWLPQAGPGRLIIPDYKTCLSAEPDALGRAVHRYGYHQQADWYRSGAQALGLAGEDAAFVFVCQEKTPPYLVTVVELDATALRIGAARNRRAIDTYAECVEAGHWPAYSDDIAYLPLPIWAEIRETEEYL